MVLVIDTFKLIKGVGKSIGIYNLTKSIVTKLGAENVRRGLPEKIIILGNEFNRSDMDAEGVEFYQVPGDPKSRVKILLWELFGVRKEAAGEPSRRPVNAARVILLLLAVLLIILGTVNGSLKDVLLKAINICTECVGLG